jgi:sodium-dependent dicarboxylate transporter 2/3/5
MRRIAAFLRGKNVIVICALVVFGALAKSDIGASTAHPSSSIAIGLGILCCIALLWLSEALPLAVTALLVPVLATTSGLMDMSEALSAFADPLIFLFLGGFALAAALSAQKLDLWLAQHLMRWGGGNYFRLCLLIFAATAVLSMWMNNTATTAMMIPIALSILQRLAPADQSAPNRMFLLLGLAYAAGIGGMGTIIGSPPNAIAASALDLSFGEWMAKGLPAVVLLLPMMVGLLMLFLRPNRQATLTFTPETLVFDRPRQITLALFALTVLAWMTGSWLRPLLGIHAIDSWVALVSLLLLCITRVVTWKQIQQEVDWGVLLLFGGGLALSAVLKKSGCSQHVAHLLSTSISQWSFTAIILTAILFAMLSAAFTSNTGSAALLIPIFGAIATELSLAPATLVIPIALASSCSFVLPISTPPNALVYSTGHIPQAMMVKNGLGISLLSALVLLALATLLA